MASPRSDPDSEVLAGVAGPLPPMSNGVLTSAPAEGAVALGAEYEEPGSAEYDELESPEYDESLSACAVPAPVNSTAGVTTAATATPNAAMSRLVLVLWVVFMM